MEKGYSIKGPKNSLIQHTTELHLLFIFWSAVVALLRRRKISRRQNNRFSTMKELRGRREGSSRQALWERHWRLHSHRFPLCHLGMIGDWFFNAIVSSINGYWVIWEIRHWKYPYALTLTLSPSVRLFAFRNVHCDVPKILRQRSLRQSHIHEQRSHGTTLALWDWIRPFPMEQIICDRMSTGHTLKHLYIEVGGWI